MNDLSIVFAAGGMLMMIVGAVLMWVDERSGSERRG